MAVHDNSLSDVETDLRFGRTYSFLAVLGKSLLAAFALFIISEEGIKDSLLLLPLDFFSKTPVLHSEKERKILFYLNCLYNANVIHIWPKTYRDLIES